MAGGSEFRFVFQALVFFQKFPEAGAKRAVGTGEAFKERAFGSVMAATDVVVEFGFGTGWERTLGAEM